MSFNVRNKGSRLLFESIMIKSLIVSLTSGVLPNQAPRHEFAEARPGSATRHGRSLPTNQKPHWVQAQNGRD
jgi:hypothetical protein